MAQRNAIMRTMAVAAVTVAIAGGGRPALAFDDGYQNVFSSVLQAVGLVPGDKAPEIDYRERAPLVLPPKTTLVKPVEPGSARSAAWPTDPDVIRRRKEAEEARSPFGKSEKDGPRMSKDEMLKFRALQPDLPDLAPSGCRHGQDSTASCRLDPDEMKAEEERFKKANPDWGKTVTAGAEPARMYLTQPPTGYMKSTKTVAATREAPVPRRDTSSSLSSYINEPSKNIDPLNN